MWNGLGFRHELELTENRFAILAAQACGECNEQKDSKCETPECCEIFRQKVEALTYVN